MYDFQKQGKTKLQEEVTKTLDSVRWVEYKSFQNSPEPGSFFGQLLDFSGFEQ